MSPAPRRPEARPTATVVVCAYTEDRWDDIVSGLAGVRSQTVAPLEVLVVIDHNPALQARCERELTGVRVVPNTLTKGLSGARNTAVALARGEVTVFLDDDATPEPRWLELLLAAYDDPRVQAVGGSASPVWPAGRGRPDQLAPELDWVIGCTYVGQPTRRSDVRNLMGCNMSFRTSVFAEVGGFDETAGRVGTIPLGCEETELCIRLTQRVPGARVVFEPAAVVHHHVTEPRTTWAYLRSRSMGEGLSKAAMARLVGAGDATSTERDYVRRVLTAGVRRELARGLRGRAAGWRGAAGIVTALAWTSVGYLRGRLGLGSRMGRTAAAGRAG
ncbi:glycosyltransferase family 2 protein [Nocardioides sp. SYSU D00038]|uniref:glycosyltransferase family 2 protein n=1 Tax=Nocardioides sp. SYSU D00038 TaxID=2812554 RepID=UPI001968923E|nr:glycosyltransferase [Nocardioides sp. SYSU D00038]